MGLMNNFSRGLTGLLTRNSEGIHASDRLILAEAFLFPSIIQDDSCREGLENGSTLLYGVSNLREVMFEYDGRRFLTRENESPRNFRADKFIESLRDAPSCLGVFPLDKLTLDYCVRNLGEPILDVACDPTGRFTDNMDLDFYKFSRKTLH